MENYQFIFFQNIMIQLRQKDISSVFQFFLEKDFKEKEYRQKAIQCYVTNYLQCKGSKIR